MASYDDFDEEMKKRVTEINKIIQNELPPVEGVQKTLLDAVDYSMLVGGKKLRPLLMQQTYFMFGGTSAVIEPFMVAIEMIHTQSLVHDDLPSVDNDEYRRGKKTTHAVYGEGMAVLAGDALLNLAYEKAMQAFDMEPGNPNVARALRILARKTGVYGMLGGQSVDVENAGKPLTEKQLYFIYSLKTGALIEASMMIGAVLADATDEELEKVEQAARNIGLAFQIQDDILDASDTEETPGKPIGSDAKNGRTTYVDLVGMEQAHRDVARYSNEAVRLLAGLRYENDFLEELILRLINRSV